MSDSTLQQALASCLSVLNWQSQEAKLGLLFALFHSDSLTCIPRVHLYNG